MTPDSSLWGKITDTNKNKNKSCKVYGIWLTNRMDHFYDILIEPWTFSNLKTFSIYTAWNRATIKVKKKKRYLQLQIKFFEVSYSFETELVTLFHCVFVFQCCVGTISQ